MTVPSRNTNPFVTCWTRPGALTWVASPCDPGGVVDRLRRADWRGQIVGPHGAGKSCLLSALVAPLRETGVDPTPHTAGEPLPPGDKAFYLVEAFERLGPFGQLRLLGDLRRRAAGFVVTTHRPLGWVAPGLAAVAHLDPDEGLVAALFDRLTAERPTPVPAAAAVDSFRVRGGNLREVWFDLYCQHEQLTRGRRTLPAVAAYYGRSRTGRRPRKAVSSTGVQ